MQLKSSHRYNLSREWDLIKRKKTTDAAWWWDAQCFLLFYNVFTWHSTRVKKGSCHAIFCYTLCFTRLGYVAAWFVQGKQRCAENISEGRELDSWEHTSKKIQDLKFKIFKRDTKEIQRPRSSINFKKKHRKLNIDKNEGCENKTYLKPAYLCSKIKLKYSYPTRFRLQSVCIEE